MFPSHPLQEGGDKVQRWKCVKQLSWPWLVCKCVHPQGRFVSPGQGEPQGTVAVAPISEQVHLCSTELSPDLLHHLRVKPPLVWQGPAS